jgi:hydrogenase maturation protein HypF
MAKDGAFEIRVRGRVQGVGFRPAVWRHARALALDGDVLNDGDGVLVRVAGGRAGAAELVEALRRNPPPLAEIDSIETRGCAMVPEAGFRIVKSQHGVANTQVAPDARLCAACEAEIADPAARRFGYAFANCTHCGPRLTIINAIPYDRATTTMVEFPMCADCRAEYGNPDDRRFHAEPIACPACGPRLSLRDSAGAVAGGDPTAEAARLLAAGAILAIKGLGGYQLACDATNAEAVARLRRGKRRDGKPFALMVRDLEMARRHCELDEVEARLLEGAAAPIVLLRARPGAGIAAGVAPGLTSLGVMLPTTPLHALLLARVETPLVMTSGNLTGEPQIIDDAEAAEEFAAIASHILSHDRAIANRVDDSVVRVMAGVPRLLRRARGYAPAPIRLPVGFEAAPDLLALGGELKSAFCLLKDGQAILSQHQGDLEQATAFADFRKNLALYRNLFGHVPAAVAVDMHPDYLSSKLGRGMGVPVVEVQHHHAHIASCLAENNWPLDGGKVLGIALDGLGYGDDGAIWGGEFLLADYHGFTRLAHFKPVAMPGGTAAIREPWRNLHAHLRAASIGTGAFAALQGKPLAILASMIERGINAPLASSCGRLFDAVAAALALCDGAQTYEGDAATRLEALAEDIDGGCGYDFAISSGVLDPAPMWTALRDDLAAGAALAQIAARFHAGLARALTEMTRLLARTASFDTVALSGGCFQNRLLFEQTLRGLENAGFAVLSHARVPANDGGLALGQAAIAAAQYIEGATPCA